MGQREGRSATWRRTRGGARKSRLVFRPRRSRPRGQEDGLWHEARLLVEARPGAQFVPINLREVDQIILPPLHLDANFVSEIKPIEFADVVGSQSPWRKEFCRIRARARLAERLDRQRSLQSWRRIVDKSCVPDASAASTGSRAETP